MRRFYPWFLQIGLPAMFAACFSLVAVAQDSEWNRVVDGLKIHLGVQPANVVPNAIKIAQGHTSSNNDSYHLVIVLFDVASGKPVDGAQVKATVAEIGLSGVRKRMEPLGVKNDANYYGNFFTMLPGRGPYRIAVEIQGIKGHDQVNTSFEYNP